MSYLRIAGAVVAAALLGFLWWRVSLSFSQGEQLDEQRDHITSLEVAAARDQRTANEIATFRSQTFEFNKAWHEDLDSKPLTHEVQSHVDPKTGQCEPHRERDPVRFRVLYNEAVTGAAGVP